MSGTRSPFCHQARPLLYFLCVVLLLAGTLSVQWGSLREELRWTLERQETSECSSDCEQSNQISAEFDKSTALPYLERQEDETEQLLESELFVEEGPTEKGDSDDLSVQDDSPEKDSFESRLVEDQAFEERSTQALSEANLNNVRDTETEQHLAGTSKQTTAPNRCHSASQGSKEPFFDHCVVPDKKGASALEAYVDRRLSTYSGNPDCQEGLIEFHCVEFAARQEGWCNWTSAQEVNPPPETNFLVRPLNELSSSPGVPASHEDQRLIFYYPSYAFLSILERSISALQHPNHVFLISVDEPDYADAAFVSGAQKMAVELNDLYFDNVFLVQQDRVIYETSTQILTAWPFLAWSLVQVTGWTHFVLMDAQTYPVVSNEKLREVLWERRDKIIFAKTPYEISTGPDWEGDQRRYEEVLPYCEGETDERHVYSQQASKMGSWTDEEGQLRDGYHRVDWLDLQLGTGWEFGKTGGNMVIIPRDVVNFLVSSPEAKMWVQYFRFMVNACEHLIVSIVHYYFRHKVASDYSSCFMLWGGGPENVVLREEDIQTMTSSETPYLFARKFRLPESSDLLSKINKELRQ